MLPLSPCLLSRVHDNYSTVFAPSRPSKQHVKLSIGGQLGIPGPPARLLHYGITLCRTYDGLDEHLVQYCMLGRSRRRSRSNLTGATHARSWGGVLDHRIVFFGFRPDAKLASCTSHSTLYSCVRAAADCTGLGRSPGCYNRDRPRCRYHRVRRPHSFLHLRPRTTFFLSHKERGGETVDASTRTYIRFRQGRAHSRTAPPPAHSSRERQAAWVV